MFRKQFLPKVKLVRVPKVESDELGTLETLKRSAT